MVSQQAEDVIEFGEIGLDLPFAEPLQAEQGDVE